MIWTKVKVTKLHQKYNLKMMNLEENLQALMNIPTTKHPPGMECLTCLETMPQKVAKCYICTPPVMGRATAMEQMIRSLHNID